MGLKKIYLKCAGIALTGGLLLGGCSQESGPPATKIIGDAPTGIAAIKIVSAADSPFSRIADSAVATISADDMLTVVCDLSVTSTAVEGMIKGIPAGKDRTITINVYDAAHVVQYTGSGSIDVVADSVVHATIDIRRILGDVNVDGAIIEREVDEPEPVLIAHWSFDSSGNNTYYDITGSGYNIISKGDVSLVDGIEGQALHCLGGGFELRVNNSADNFNLTKFSIETWLYSTHNSKENPATMKILDFQKNASGLRNGYAVQINTEGKILFAIASNYSNAQNNSTWKTATSETIIESERWYHIVCTYDGWNMKVYINGIIDAITPFSGSYLVPNEDARIGCQIYFDSEKGETIRDFLDGKIDEMKLYKYALSAQTVKKHYADSKPGD